MREILFKGKRKDNGEWIEGYYFKSWRDIYLLWGTTNGESDMIEVIPETVCQYTDKKSSDKINIFDEDIIVANESVWHGKIEGKVFWKDFMWKVEDDVTEDIVCLFNCSNIKIIGNIHDK